MQLSTRERFGLVLVFGLLCYGAGRYATPARVEDHVVTVDKVRKVAVETIVAKSETKVVENAEAAKDETKEKVVKFKRTKTPDGTVTEEGEIIYRQRTTESLASQLRFTTSAQVQIARSTTVEEDHSRKEDHIVVAEQPRWMVGGGVGGSFGLAPLQASPVYAAFGSYRFLGPVNVWGVVTFEQATLKPAGIFGLAASF